MLSLNAKISLSGGRSGSSGDSSQNTNSETQAGGTEVLPDLQVPKMYSVILLNDDFSPMDFVILVLRRFFGHKDESATQIMLDVHRKGAGVAGVYTLEIAEMKTMQVNQFSQMHQHPLKCIMQEAPS
ncbi:MAG: ATP-dependent Clp protease adapter ClpS [Bdellovibrionaceae bacterium]|jgi:ATP-dependent Clp protease adaptor protein ClpS|nr:ATP-dependent Clp protease adapter ClpS [Pseudobdellovibrionaceae bacterium]